MENREMSICNNYKFRGDWGKVEPIENYVKIYLKNLKIRNQFKNIENKLFSIFFFSKINRIPTEFFFQI